MSTSNPNSSSGGDHQRSSFPKKKRSLPGNPDPDAEVIAFSPKTLMATNRFVCEICGKGFQRDQNLQLHRRGHNLPWKLKQRGGGKDDGATAAAARKKVYVCPEATCVHHHPSRALGDLTGIKKHFSRKHGEKKWKCDKCAKKYAVMSDWKAHAKVCGTREYRCDCGTLFSRRDSFVTHRAFCDALAEENARAVLTPSPVLPPPPPAVAQHGNHQLLFFPPINAPMGALQPASFLHFRSDADAALAAPPPPPQQADVVAAASWHSSPAAAGHMSATALLQKAAQMGSTNISRPGNHGHFAGHDGAAAAATASAVFGTADDAADIVQDMMASNLCFGDAMNGGGGDVGLGLTRDFLGTEGLM